MEALITEAGRDLNILHRIEGTSSALASYLSNKDGFDGFGPHSPIKDAGYLDSLSLAYDKREETHQTGKMELSGFLSAINFSQIYSTSNIFWAMYFFASNTFCKSNLPEHVLGVGFP